MNYLELLGASIPANSLARLFCVTTLCQCLQGSDSDTPSQGHGRSQAKASSAAVLTGRKTRSKTPNTQVRPLSGIISQAVCVAIACRSTR